MNADQQVIGFVLDHLDRGLPTWLCTVLSTWGSSPRPPGSLFAFDELSRSAGSLSGGCVEQDLVEKTVKAYHQGDAAAHASGCRIIKYGATAEETARFRLPCGGVLKVAVERLLPDEQNPADGHSRFLDLFQHLVRHLQKRKAVIRRIVFEPYAATLLNPDELDTAQMKDLQCSSLIETSDGFQHLLGPNYTLLLVGISEVSKAVASMATMLDYEIIVCDPRSELIEQWTIEGVTLICAMPDDVINQQKDLRRTAILALTHDPRIDDMGLMEALTTDAFYIGAMGSKLTSENRRARLRQLELSDEQLDALRAPVGLDIGSKTPAEIALSILAEITLERSLRAKS